MPYAIGAANRVSCCLTRSKTCPALRGAQQSVPASGKLETRARLGRSLCIAVALLEVGSLACFTASAAKAQSRQQIAPEAYVDLDGIWPSSRIPVCWEPGASQYEQEKGWVENALDVTIEWDSPVRLIGWGECDPEELGIRVRVADEWPRSAAGRQWARDASNKKLQDAAGRFIQRPTAMTLNFTFDEYFRSCRSDREHCIRAIAVHEFLHAVGFLHEQLRSDAPEECKQLYAGQPDFPGYRPAFGTITYDPDSHANYCADMYRKPIRLSAGDVAVLRQFYTTQ